MRRLTSFVSRQSDGRLSKVKARRLTSDEGLRAENSSSFFPCERDEIFNPPQKRRTLVVEGSKVDRPLPFCALCARVCCGKGEAVLRLAGCCCCLLGSRGMDLFLFISRHWSHSGPCLIHWSPSPDSAPHKRIWAPPPRRIMLALLGLEEVMHFFFLAITVLASSQLKMSRIEPVSSKTAHSD